jgi:Transposase DDE domain
MRWQGRPLRSEDGGPPDRAQRNFTDPDSRILPTRDGFIQGYNGQIVVDAAPQVIVACRLVTTAADYRAWRPLVDDIHAHLGRKPREVSGDAGFCTEANLAALTARRIKAYLPPGRARHSESHAAGHRKLTKRPLMSAMAETLKRAGRRSRYRLRKQVVEPVFGQMKQARGFRQFLLRGLDQVRAEWAMICTVHNLLKLAHAAGR